MAKYSIVELTKVASRKTGEIETQCKLADEFKKDKHNNHLLRNHQLLPKVTLVVTTAVATTETMVIKA